MKSVFPCVLLLFCGCERASDGTAASPEPTASHLAAPRASAAQPAASAGRAAALSAGATACGELGCLQFLTPEDPFRWILSTKPRVLAVGEAHAQKGKQNVTSSAKRFTDTLLPLLAGHASDLVVELMLPNPQCKKKTEKVRQKHQPVTSQQAPSSQNEYVSMGERARGLGIVPDLLRPSCADLDAIDKAGDEAIGRTLETIARLTRQQVEKLLARIANTPADRGKMVVTYGGVLHNDLAPATERAAWSFGPQLSRATDGHYVEVDLFVPEFIENNETWRKLAWFPHYERDKLGDKTTLFKLGPQRYAIILPATPEPQ
ncbi:MAG: hypothetical protein MUF54_03190 [Polyangiaceae bacterium]|nr:hypothetical protein [Polyangiaceae bacterium]